MDVRDRQTGSRAQQPPCGASRSGDGGPAVGRHHSIAAAAHSARRSPHQINNAHEYRYIPPVVIQPSHWPSFKNIQNMWLLVIISAYCASVSVEAGDAKPAFHKCCLKNQGLVRVVDIENGTQYECLDCESVEKSYNISKSPLIVGDAVPVEYRDPNQMCVWDLVNQTSEELDIRLSMTTDICYDRLLLEIVNGTVNSDVSKIISLSCILNNTDQIPDKNIDLNHIRKCCPKGYSYDTVGHLCKKTEEFASEESLLRRLNVSSGSIYELDLGLHCKYEQYALDLSEDFYSLEVVGSELIVVKKDGAGGGRALQGEWCVEQRYGRAGLVARVCSRDCDAYGAFCVRKCCPVGKHYYMPNCRRPICTSVNEIPFNISKHIEPLNYYGITGDIMGIKENLLCEHGKVMLDIKNPLDQHELDQYGHLQMLFGTVEDYCFEMVDKRHCEEKEILLATINCFVKGLELEKDFAVSFWLISLSSVCLALTLIVYCSLPELRNLHGRNLICHVSMMLLAFTCLARVQYSLVPDRKLCTALGYGIYFGFMAAFAWLNVMCLDIWWTFGSMRSVQPMRKTGTEWRRFLWYSLYAWSIAISLTLTMFLLDKYPVAYFLDANIGSGMCWFGSEQNSRTDWPHYIFFVIPMGIGTCTNFVLFMLTARHCARVKSEVHRLQAGSVGDRAKRRFRIDRAKYILTGKLWVVMGAGWISELASTLATHPEWLWSIVDLFNELQGVFIFLILVFKPKLYYTIRRRLGLEKPDAQKQASSGRTSSTFLSRTISSDERAIMRVSQGNNLKLP